MSVRVSPSPVVEEDRAQQVSLLGGSLALNEAEGPWGHRTRTSEPSIPLHPVPGSQEREMMEAPGVAPAMSAPPPPPLNLPSRPRPNIGLMPRVSTAVDQPAVQRSISTDQESGGSPMRSSHVSFRMSNSTSSTSEPPDSQTKERGPLSNPVVAKESRRLRSGSAAESEWERIQKLRVENWSLRSQIREMRNNLRQMQRAKSDADDILFRRMTVQGLNLLHGMDNLPSTGQKTLNELLEDCQKARDAYGPLEDDCNRLEDQLSGQEFELDRLEEHFYTRPLEEVHVMLDRPLTPAGVDDAQSYSRSVDEEDEESDFHPLVSRYLSRMGDLDLLQERFEDLLDEKRGLEEQRERRRQLGLTLDPEDQQWLENAQSAEDDLSEKIRILHKDLEVMKLDCLSRGLVDEDGEPTDFPIREQHSFDDEEDMNPRDQKSEYVKYPLLLPYPGMKPTREFHYEPRPDEKSERTIISPAAIHTQKQTISATPMLLSSLETWNSSSRINEWLLQRLRMSALDVNLLARTFQDISGVITDRWQIAVLRLWYRDATMRGADGEVRIYTDSMTTQAPAISNPSTGQIKAGKTYPTRRPSFSERISQFSTSSLDDDEVEIVEYNPRRRMRISNQPWRM
jgi:hypothetical protein